jgi:hypothetical protein
LNQSLSWQLVSCCFTLFNSAFSKDFLIHFFSSIIESLIMLFLQDFSLRILVKLCFLKTYQCLLFGCNWWFWKLLQVFLCFSLLKMHSRIEYVMLVSHDLTHSFYTPQWYLATSSIIFNALLRNRLNRFETLQFILFLI